MTSASSGTAAALAVKATSANLESTYHSPVRTVLHKSTSILPRVLPNRPNLPTPSTAAFWEEVLDEAYDRLHLSTADAPARVVGKVSAIM